MQTIHKWSNAAHPQVVQCIPSTGGPMHSIHKWSNTDHSQVVQCSPSTSRLVLEPLHRSGLHTSTVLMVPTFGVLLTGGVALYVVVTQRQGLAVRGMVYHFPCVTGGYPGLFATCAPNGDVRSKAPWTRVAWWRESCRGDWYQQQIQAPFWRLSIPALFHWHAGLSAHVHYV
jgi:hypothetical protein